MKLEANEEFMENLSSQSAREKVETAELNKTIKKKQLRGLRKHRTETIQEVIKQGKGFKMARKKLSSGKLQFTGVLEEDSSLTTDRDRIVDRAQKSMKIYTRIAQILDLPIRRCNMAWKTFQRSNRGKSSLQSSNQNRKRLLDLRIFQSIWSKR